MELQCPSPMAAKKRRANKPTSTLRRETPGVRLNVYVPDELERRLRIRCAEERRSMSDAVTHAIEKWLG